MRRHWEKAEGNARCFIDGSSQDLWSGTGPILPQELVEKAAIHTSGMLCELSLRDKLKPVAISEVEMQRPIPTFQLG